MTPQLTRSLAAAAVGGSVVALTLVGMPSDAANGKQSFPAVASPVKGSDATTHKEAGDHSPADFDVRDLSGTALVRHEAASTRSRGESVRAYMNGLGQFADVQYDALTNTPRILANTAGYLTAKSSQSPQTIVHNYLRAHLAVLGLDEADLATLVFRHDEVTSDGVHVLSWEQQIDGKPVFGNGLKAVVTKDGRLVQITGAPVHDLAGLAKAAPAVSLSASAARTAAAKNVDGKVDAVGVQSTRSGLTTWKNDDFAKLVWFLTPQGLRQGWSTYVQTGDDSAYQHVIDAATGKALYRHSTVDSARGDAYVYDYYPGAPKTQSGTKTVTTYTTKTVTKKVKVHRHGKLVTVTKKVKIKVAHHTTVPVYTTPGAAKVVNFIKNGWLSKDATTLDGTSVITWADLTDDDEVTDGEQTPVPGNAQGATGKITPYKDTAVDVFGAGGSTGQGPAAIYDFSHYCTASYVCTWDPQAGPETQQGGDGTDVSQAWSKNLAANENNAFFLANTYHDYLEKDPAIGFNTNSGNFSTADHDPVLQQVLDGAATDNGMPDSAHIDNANMNTPPDGTPPRMQMYLWHAAGYPNDYDPYNPTSGAFDASILLHEYTHGLSNRLVVDADGDSTLNSLQAGSMGEAWSDYYAMDYLVTKHYQADTSKDGEIFEGQYVMGGATADNGNYKVPFRTMPMDCSVGSTNDECFDSYFDIGHTGGYTYGDMPVISGSPEVHSSGEVWAQTLWDIRKALGHTVADRVITDGMRFSADDPSMLDMRNAILEADKVDYASAHTNKLWQLFSTRGMGFYAASIDGADTAPAEDFSMPPSPKTINYSQFITGTVTDGVTGQPVGGATVRVAGFGDKYTAVTTASGKYTIGSAWGMYPGTYPKLVVSAPGYFAESQPVTVPVGNHVTKDVAFTAGKDWAASSLGSSIVDFNGPDFTSNGCGPDDAIDTSFGTGWGSTSSGDNGAPSGTFIPKHVTVKLAQPIDISSFGVVPGAICGDPGSASTGDYQIEVSSNSTNGIDGTWTVVSAPGARFNSTQRTTLNSVAPTGATNGVTYVRFTAEGNQVYDAAVANGDPLVVANNPAATFAAVCGSQQDQGNYGGCQFTDLSEFAVFGTPAS